MSHRDRLHDDHSSNTMWCQPVEADHADLQRLKLAVLTAEQCALQAQLEYETTMVTSSDLAGQLAHQNNAVQVLSAAAESLTAVVNVKRYVPGPGAWNDVRYACRRC